MQSNEVQPPCDHRRSKAYGEYRLNMRPWSSRIVIILAGLYALFQSGHGVYFAVVSSCDLHTFYEMWASLWNRQTAAVGLRYPYFPHALLMLSPIFTGGFLIAKYLWMTLNFVFIFYIWRRISGLLALNQIQHWLWLCLFCSWACVRITIGNGQFGLFCLAAVLWAYPFTTRQSVPLLVASFKHSLTFPLFLYLLMRRWRAVVLTTVVSLGVLIGALWWSGLSVSGYWQTYHSAASTTATGVGDTNVMPFFEQMLPPNHWLLVAIGLAWVVSFVTLVRLVQDERILMSALLLMSLWPLYHRSYDLVVMGPALAVLIKHYHPLVATGVSLLLAGAYEHLSKHNFYGSLWLSRLSAAYYPLVIFCLLGLLLWVSYNIQRATRREIVV